jgi:predicted PurR-regulated permease PerM
MGRKIFAAIVAALFFYVASPLVYPVAMGAVLATLFIPWLERLEKRKLATPLASGLLTLVIALFFILPFGLLLFVGVKEAFQQVQQMRIQQAAVGSPGAVDGGWAGAFVSMPRVHAILEKITEWFPIQLKDVTEAAQDLTRSAATKLAELFGQFISALPGMAMAMAVAVVSVYFFLTDGRRLVMFFRRNSVFSPQQTDQLIHSLAGTCRSVILASVVSGLAQASLEFVVCLFTQVPNAALVATLVFMGSFIPVLGSVPVTVGVAIQQFLLGRTAAGVILLVAAVVVGLLDNFIRPAFLRGSANLHPLLAFVAAFGGLQTLGFSGVFLGPIIASMFVVTVQILVRGDQPPKTERPLL